MYDIHLIFFFYKNKTLIWLLGTKVQGSMLLKNIFRSHRQKDEEKKDVLSLDNLHDYPYANVK